MITQAQFAKLTERMYLSESRGLVRTARQLKNMNISAALTRQLQPSPRPPRKPKRKSMPGFLTSLSPVASYKQGSDDESRDFLPKIHEETSPRNTKGKAVTFNETETFSRTKTSITVIEMEETELTLPKIDGTENASADKTNGYLKRSHNNGGIPSVPFEPVFHTRPNGVRRGSVDNSKELKQVQSPNDRSKSSLLS